MWSTEESFEKAKISDYVIIHCHDVSKSLNNQHSFGFTPQFFNNLIKKIYTLDLTNKIGLNKNELYILCSNEKLESFEKILIKIKLNSTI